MQEEQNSKHFNDEIDLRTLFHVLSKGKRTIIYVTALISTLAIILSLLTPNIYESRALLAPVNPANSISGALQSYSGLAGIAGISLPTNSEENNSAKALKKLKSLSFFENNILNNIFLPDLMAVKSWDYKTNTLNYDSSIYEAKSKTWVRDYSYPKKPIPSAQEDLKYLLKSI